MYLTGQSLCSHLMDRENEELGTLWVCLIWERFQEEILLWFHRFRGFMDFFLSHKSVRFQMLCVKQCPTGRGSVRSGWRPPLKRAINSSCFYCACLLGWVSQLLVSFSSTRCDQAGVCHFRGRAQMVGTRKWRGTGGSGRHSGCSLCALASLLSLICIPCSQLSAAEAHPRCVLCKLKCGMPRILDALEGTGGCGGVLRWAPLWFPQM